MNEQETLKSADRRTSLYLQRRLRSLEEVEQDRAQRDRPTADAVAVVSAAAE
jgi:hypothetical protein